MYGLEDEDEETRSFTAGRETVEALLAEGRAHNGVTPVARQWFPLDRKTLRSGALPKPRPTH